MKAKLYLAVAVAALLCCGAQFLTLAAQSSAHERHTFTPELMPRVLPSALTLNRISHVGQRRDVCDDYSEMPEMRRNLICELTYDGERE